MNMEARAAWERSGSIYFTKRKNHKGLFAFEPIGGWKKWQKRREKMMEIGRARSAGKDVSDMLEEFKRDITGRRHSRNVEIKGDAVQPDQPDHDERPGPKMWRKSAYQMMKRYTIEDFRKDIKAAEEKRAREREAAERQGAVAPGGKADQIQEEGEVGDAEVQVVDYDEDARQIHQGQQEVQEDQQLEIAQTEDKPPKVPEWQLKYGRYLDVPVITPKRRRRSPSRSRAPEVAVPEKRVRIDGPHKNHTEIKQSSITESYAEVEPPIEGSSMITHPKNELEVATHALPPLKESDIRDEEIYDMTADYRGVFTPPEEDTIALSFPKLRKKKTRVEKQREVVEKWEKLLEERQKLDPPNQHLINQAKGRLRAHEEELERRIEEEPSLPTYKETRLVYLRECLERYTVPEDIVNVKAAIKAFEDDVLGNNDKWTVFYNGRIVDRITSYRELLWSVRHPLYQEIYGKEGSIWLEPSVNDSHSKGYAAIHEPMFVSGEHWYINQHIGLPWTSKEEYQSFDFLLDTGSSDPLMAIDDFLDLGLIREGCPHVMSRPLSTANGIKPVDFYPIFINHNDPATGEPLYPMADSVAGVNFDLDIERLSGLDLWRFAYVASEPSTGYLSYASRFQDLKLRESVSPGFTMTPRAWYTRVWDETNQMYIRSATQAHLVERPRLLDRMGNRWVHNRPYRHQEGDINRKAHIKVDYLPGHRVHPPTPDTIRIDRAYYWSNYQPYRDNRPAVKAILHPRTNTVPQRDYMRPRNVVRLSHPRNPWQYLEGVEREWVPVGPMTNPPRNPLGTVYWDDQFPAEAMRLGHADLIPNWEQGDFRGPRRFPSIESYFNMGVAYRNVHGPKEMKGIETELELAEVVEVEDEEGEEGEGENDVFWGSGENGNVEVGEEGEEEAREGEESWEGEEGGEGGEGGEDEEGRFGDYEGEK
ncbi:hypothetical protein BDZ91DRAFT_762937 [Kalaharituber pfeilii]|nr:hypothetical protein BDZ91DRAFT_762937 [Kalaharituber pfeilii]